MRVVLMQAPSLKMNTHRTLRMMQSAWCASDNCRVTLGIDPLAHIRALSQARQLTCPNCKQRVQAKAGPVRAWHFAHWDVTAVECYDDYGEPDGPEHQAMKYAMLQFLRRVAPEGSVVEMEVPIPETSQRADVLARFPDGRRIAVEVQVTAITGSQWTDRHELYHSAGIQDMWLLGQSLFDALELRQSHLISDMPDAPRGYSVTRGRCLPSLMTSIGEETKRIYFLDALSEPALPRLGMLCRLDVLPPGFRGAYYTFPLDGSVISLNPPVFSTPYEPWATSEAKRKREEDAMRRAQEADRLAHEAARRDARNAKEAAELLKVDLELQIQWRRREGKLQQWRRDAEATPQWRSLHAFGLDDHILTVCDARVHGWHLLVCDPRLWITYLYSHTVLYPWQTGERVWSLNYASRCLAEQFSDYLHPSTHGDPEARIATPLAGFSEYFCQIGVLQHPSVSGAWRILEPISLEYPQLDRLKIIQDTLRQDDLLGLSNWLKKRPTPFR